MNKKEHITPLRKLQLAELETLKEFLKICKENNLTYYISGGTYLGAVRHKGFIPWDDDMDIAMPRTDFEKFVSIAEGSNLPKGYKLTTYKNTEDYNWYAPKIQNNTILVKNNSAKISRVEPAWIDIFPLDGMPKSKILQTFHKARLMSLRAIYKLSAFDNLVDTKNKRPFYEKPLVFLGKHVNLSKIINTKKALDKIDKALKKYPETKSKTYMNFMGSYKLKSIISKDIYADGAAYSFEGLSLNGPKDYDAYLRIIYGDNYMTPPKKSERNKHKTEIEQ
jgi:lipopolysaccharide cholinephosphotransferase